MISGESAPPFMPRNRGSLAPGAHGQAARYASQPRAHLWQQRHDARLGALARDDECLAQRQRNAGERHRLADAQAGAVEQQQHRLVAQPDPGLVCRLVGIVGERDRFGQAQSDGARPA